MDQPTLEQSVQTNNDIQDLQNQRVHQQDIVPSAIKPKHLAATTGSSKGNLYYSDGTNFIPLIPGTTGQALQIANGLPTWGNINIAIATSLATNTTPVTVNTATAPTAGQALVATSSSNADWQTIKPVIGSSTSSASFTATANSLVDSTATGGSASITTTAPATIFVSFTAIQQNNTTRTFYRLGIGEGSNNNVAAYTFDPADMGTANVTTVQYVHASATAGTYTYHMQSGSGNGTDSVVLNSGSVITAIAYY